MHVYVLFTAFVRNIFLSNENLAKIRAKALVGFYVKSSLNISDLN
jgi:hypothetical protein